MASNGDYVVFELSGSNAINYIQKKLDHEWMEIYLQNRGWISNLFTALLYELNYFLGPKLVLEIDGEYFEANMSLIPETRNKLILLDHFLDRGLNELSILGSSMRVAGIFNLKAFNRLIFIRRALEAYRADPSLTLVVNDDGTWEDKWPLEFKNCVQNWFNAAGIDREWRKHYLDKSTNLRTRITTILQEEFPTFYGVKYESFYSLNYLLEKKVKDHLQKVLQQQISRSEDMPLLVFDDKQLAKIAGLDSESNEWYILRELITYKPGRDINVSPFIPVILNETMKLLPFLPVFYPLDSMFSSWVYKLTSFEKDSKTIGTIGYDYGIQFEEFVRKKIRDSKPSMEVFPENLEVKPTNLNIEKGLKSVGRPKGLEIDVIAWGTDLVYVISCKSRDFHFGTQLLKRMIFVRYKDIQARLLANARDLDEVKQAADFLTNHSEQVGLPSFVNKEVIPIVVNSYYEPLCERSLRKWYETQRKLPNVETVTIGEFISFLKPS